MKDIDIQKIESIKEVVQCGADDVIVITLNSKVVSDRWINELKDGMKSLFPNNKIAILTRGMSLSLNKDNPNERNN
jgi:peroxiredoxin